MLQNLIVCFRSVVILLFVPFILIACDGSQVVLVSNVAQNAANNVILTLGNNNITAIKTMQKDGTYTITVPESKEVRALALLKDSGEPNAQFSGLGQVFKKDGFISSPLEEHARLLYALDQEISAMLSGINGVISVDTQVSLPLPSDKMYSDDNTDSKVAVLIKYRPSARVDLYINRIKNLVSAAVPGVTPAQVQVLTIMQKDV